ncbi:MAG: nicotinate (nicotinamide) nucleotide adenylyltransferase [Bacillota bacterium]|nr:nicotinate (nicotinamide) nucleotide adenylyltransferase [Bacillota bacterium]
MSRMKLAMLGGSFNPIHNAHVMLAERFEEKLQFDKVLVMPSKIPPHKSITELVSEEHRLNMCRLACENFEKAEVSEIELHRSGASYTVDTLIALNQMYGESEIYLIVGADMYLTLESWKNASKIFELATICTAPRDESDYEILLNYSKKLNIIGAKSIILKEHIADISSTDIRQILKDGGDIGSFVCPKVKEYIIKHKLYV